MGIRAKLSLVISAGIVAATAATAAALFRLQDAALRESEAEKTRLLLDTIRQAGTESLVSGDPLVVLDQLAFLRRERPELHHCRVLLAGRWHDVGGQAPPEPPGGVSRMTVTVPGAGERPSIEIEALLSSRVLEERSRRERAALARNAVRAGLAVGLLGLAGSALLAAALTRRIVRIEEALTAIGEGRLGTEVEARGSDEIARLARGVTRMSAQLKELDAMKRTFIASVTHELRSPLGAIQSQVRLALSKADGAGERTRAALARIGINAERLEHFVTSLLELAKIERGKLDFAPRASDLGQVAEDVALFFAPRAKEAGLELEAEPSPALPPMAFDPDLVAQAVTNLVSNAIKFTPSPGKVRVRVVRTRDGAACEVEDSGIGIPADAVERLFRPFERAPNAPGNTGTGLGLALVKSIAEMHGGSVAVESELGKGSRFRLELPLSPPARREVQLAE
ncbi:MAG: HAMP domain-containing histidine kinase [Elusimicrobia bacterium]|nr:HAMP domain-containing histidine kinase [Elusimicrobiota bacterium]